MKRGFTLVELSVVLIIIGLLIGGVMVGKGLIAAAQQQAIISDFQKYDVAAQSYNKKYHAWPGDDDEATRWNDPAVANGDGNGWLPNPAVTAGEYYQFWLHLSKAGLITGTYTGSANSVPVAPLEGFFITHWYDTIYPARQAFYLTVIPQPNQAVGSPAPLKINTELAIDKKIDDGISTTGNLQGTLCSAGGPYPGCSGIFYIYKN